MGTSNTKHHPGSVTNTFGRAGRGAVTEQRFSWSGMEGPNFHCAYLGFSPISKPPTSLSVLQAPIKELYIQYRKTPASGRSVNLKLVQNGVLVTLFENGSVSAELFFDFASVTFVEAAKFMPVKTSNKPKAMFVPADESKGSISDKNAFQLEKAFNFLVTSTHPPLVACVVRRPAGVKALDCHVFALDTTENALHISALISSSQGVKGDNTGEVARSKSMFDRGARGDVIRTDHGEYSVYRGPHSYDQPPTHRYSDGIVPEIHRDQRYNGGVGSDIHPETRYNGGPVQGFGRNVNMGHPEGGPLILTQDNFRGPPHSAQQSYGGPPGAKGYGRYEQSSYGPPGVPTYPRPPDVIMHAHQWSGESPEQLPHDRVFNGSDPNAGGIRMRYEEAHTRSSNSNNIRLSGVADSRIAAGPAPGHVNHRLSMNMVPPNVKPTHRPNEISPMFITGQQQQQQHVEPVLSPVTPKGAIISTRSVHPFSPTNPQGFDPTEPVFSASNLESRGQGTPPEPVDRNLGGKPIAKVPPHMKGVKVLPSDFRMVKLKPKTDKRPDMADDEDYDNVKEVVDKYKEYQHQEKGTSYAGGMKQTSTKPNNRDPDGFVDFSEQGKLRSDERNKDFQFQWDETVSENKALSRGYNVQGTDSSMDPRNYGGVRDYSQRQEDNNNRNRYGAPASGRDKDPEDRWAPNSHPPYGTDVNGDAHVRTKELEIANMFSNVKLQGGAYNKRSVYRQPGDRHEIEDGLGYLP